MADTQTAAKCSKRRGTGTVMRGDHTAKRCPDCAGSGETQTAANLGIDTGITPKETKE